jgi:hypothetical protein
MSGNSQFILNVLNYLSAHKNIVMALVELRDQEQYMEHINEEEKIVIRKINYFIEKLNNIQMENNDILNEIFQCIYNACNHSWITDSIDIALDNHSILTYCSMCGYSKH